MINRANPAVSYTKDQISLIYYDALDRSAAMKAGAEDCILPEAWLETAIKFNIKVQVDVETMLTPRRSVTSSVEMIQAHSRGRAARNNLAKQKDAADVIANTYKMHKGKESSKPKGKIIKGSTVAVGPFAGK